MNYNIKREQQDLTKTIQIKPKFMILNVARNDNSCNEWRQFIVHQRNYDLKSGGYDWNDFISEIIDVEKDGSTMHLLENGNNLMDVIGLESQEPQIVDGNNPKIVTIDKVRKRTNGIVCFCLKMNNNDATTVVVPRCDFNKSYGISWYKYK